MKFHAKATRIFATHAKNLNAKKSATHLDLRAFFELRFRVRGDACARGGCGVVGAEGLVGLGALVEAVLLWRATTRVGERRWDEMRCDVTR